MEEFFTAGADHTYYCNFCSKGYKKDNGFTNLMAHLNNQHPDYVKVYALNHPALGNSGEGASHFLATESAKTIWHWIRKVVLLPLPFSAVENEIAREGCLYKGIDVDTLKKWMKLLKEYLIERVLKPQLNKNIGKFPIIFDGWSHGHEHYLALFSSYFDDKGCLQTPMLSCSVPEDIDEGTVFAEDLDDDNKFFGFTSADLFDMINLTLHDEYDMRLPDDEGNLTTEISADNIKDLICCLISDNCSTNR
jgi:hypothetical protein